MFRTIAIALCAVAVSGFQMSRSSRASLSMMAEKSKVQRSSRSILSLFTPTSDLYEYFLVTAFPSSTP
jgi:hypothetical protein